MPWKNMTRAGFAKWGLTVTFVLLVLVWLRYAPPEAPWSPQRILGAIMPQPKVVEKIVTVTVPGPERIRIVPKEKIVEIYHDLPTSATMTDNTAHVVAVACIPPAPAGGTAISVMKTTPEGVGESHIEFKPTPVPFFQAKREMGIRGGFGTEGILAEIYARPLRVGPVEIEGRVFGNSGGSGESGNVGAVILLDWRF
jgi:hypothetical protein